MRRKLLQYAKEQGITSGIVFKTKSGKPVKYFGEFLELNACGADN